MREVITDHGPGTIIIPAGSLARYAEFWISLECLMVPPGTMMYCMRGADIPHQLNEGCRNMTGGWAWFLGDDHKFRSDVLLKLLDRQVDVVLPIVPRRDPPFVPVLMHGPVSKMMARYDWSEIPTKGMFQLPKWDSAGQAGCLIRKHVLDKLGDPWFEAGKLDPGRLMEDMYFIQRLHEMDIPIHVDCEQVLAHIANIAITPVLVDGRWYPGYPGPDGSAVAWDEPSYTYLGAGCGFR